MLGCRRPGRMGARSLVLCGTDRDVTAVSGRGQRALVVQEPGEDPGN